MNELLQSVHLTTTVDSLGIWDDKLQLFGKLNEAAAGVPGRGDEDLWVTLSSMCILVIDMCARHCCVIILQLYLVPQSLLFPPQLVWDGLALCTKTEQ